MLLLSTYKHKNYLNIVKIMQKCPQQPWTSCLNFWDEAWWFLSLRVFGLSSWSLLLFPQHFGRYVLWPSSGVCQTRKPSQNFKLRPLLNPWRSPVLIPLAITGYKSLSIPVLASNNTGILNTCTRLWLTESEQATPVN